MFDQIVEMVKHQMGKDPQINSSIPAGQQDAVHQEVASQIAQGLSTQSQAQGGLGNLLSGLQGGLGSNNPIINAISGGVVSSLGNKLGLSPAITGAIAASLPGLLQKFAHKANDPDDSSVTHDSITDMFSKLGNGGLGNIFHRN